MQLDVKYSELSSLSEEEQILINEQSKASNQLATAEKKLERLREIQELIRKDDIEQAQMEVFNAKKKTMNQLL